MGMASNQDLILYQATVGDPKLRKITLNKMLNKAWMGRGGAYKQVQERIRSHELDKED